MNEPAISHKLAQYLQPRFNDYHVDCEYNRNVESEDLRKKIYLAGQSSSSGMTVRNIVPDIIIHERGVNSKNLCIIEIKKIQAYEGILTMLGQN